MALRFYIGLHQPSDAQRFERCCLHVQRLATRRKPLDCAELLLDSRAFNELRQFGHYRASPEQFTDQVHRIAYAALVGLEQTFMTPGAGSLIQLSKALYSSTNRITE